MFSDEEHVASEDESESGGGEPDEFGFAIELSVTDEDDDGNESDGSDHAGEREFWKREQDQRLEKLEQDDLMDLDFVISEDNRPLGLHEVDYRIRHIGHSLEHATHMREIELWFSGYYQKDMVYIPNYANIGAHSGIRNFVRTSKTLRTFHYGNMCDETPDHIEFTSQYIRAVRENSNIITFRLEEYDPILNDLLCELIRGTKSIRTIEIHGNGDLMETGINREALEDLCRAFSANESLETVTFEGVSFNYGETGLNLALPQNKVVKELKFLECAEIDMKSASTFLHVFPHIEKLSTCALQPFMVYFTKTKDAPPNLRPTRIQEFNFLGDVDNATPKMKDFIATQPRLELLNLAYSTKPPNKESLKIMKSINAGIEAQKSSALKSLFLDNFIIPKQVMADMDKVVKKLEEFHLHLTGKLPPKAKKWISDPSCKLKLLRLNLHRVDEKPLRELFSALGQNKSIETLQVKNLHAPDSFLKPVLRECLSRMTQLRKLTTTSASMVRAFCSSNDKNNVTELEIESQQLSRTGILEALISFLPRHDCKLKRLTVSNLHDEEDDENDNDDNYEADPNVERQVQLVDVLSRNHSLEYLRLKGLEPAVPLFNLAVVLPSLTTLKELSITISQLWEVEPAALFGLKTAVLRGLEQNKSLTRFECDLHGDSYSFQRDIIVLCLRNKVRSLAIDQDVGEIPKEILQHAADFLL